MKLKTTAFVVLAMALIAALASAGEQTWFDMENCSMCKNYAEHPTMMKAMTWEQHKITNGFMSVSSVPAEHLDNYRSANAKCDALGAKIMAGDEVPLCGSCVAFSDALGKGAAMEKIELKNGSAMLVTSTDDAVLADLHKWVDRNNEEMKKMMAGMIMDEK